MLSTVSALCALGGGSGSELGCPCGSASFCQFAEAWAAAPQADGGCYVVMRTPCTGWLARIGTLLSPGGRTQRNEKQNIKTNRWGSVSWPDMKENWFTWRYEIVLQHWGSSGKQQQKLPFPAGGKWPGRGSDGYGMHLLPHKFTVIHWPFKQSAHTKLIARSGLI